MTYRLAIDIGGTFTDFALVNTKTGDIAVHKQLTTPCDPSECVLDGARNLLSSQNVSFSAVKTIVHATTLSTNAVIERKGANMRSSHLRYVCYILIEILCTNKLCMLC